MDFVLKPNERIDDLHRKGLKLIQNPDFFCFGVDAVLLSDFARANAGESVCDLCSGTAVIPILMTAKCSAERYVAVEIQKDCAEMAQRSILLNRLDEKISVLNADLRDCAEGLLSASFDVVTCNPPYMNAGGGIIGAASKKSISRHEIMCTIEDVAKTASRILKFSGRLYLIHRPHRLNDIFHALRAAKLEPKTMRLVQPYSGSEPNLVMIEAVRGGKPMLKTMPTLVIYNENGQYTDEIQEIYYR